MITYGKAVADTGNPTGHESENDKFWRELKSHDARVGVAPKKTAHKSEHTIAPAYNKGAYQVIPRKEVIDIGR